MTVRELMAVLERQHPDARVLIVRDPSYPWEHVAVRAVRRSTIDADDRDEHWRDDDVLVVTGDRVGFGPVEAWMPDAIHPERSRG